MAVAFPSLAKEAEEQNSSQTIRLEINQQTDTPTRVLRAPMRINIEAYYDTENHTIEICYNGEADGEVFLYLDENIIGYDSEINTSFQISSAGYYRIEIISETWIAQGSIQL